MRRIIGTSLALLLLSVPGSTLAQASLRVSPLMVDVVAPAQASALTLENTGAEDISLQIRIFEWSQVNGEDRLTPIDEVVASPPAASIPKGSSFTIRIARPGGDPIDGEKSYRLWVDELPSVAPSAEDGGRVDVRIRYDLPVFFREPGAEPQLSWRAFRSGDNVVLEASNAGNSHARIQGLKVEAAGTELSFGAGLNGYLLPSTTRRWTAPAGASFPSTGQITVVAEVGDSETRQPVTLAAL